MLNTKTALIILLRFEMKRSQVVQKYRHSLGHVDKLLRYLCGVFPDDGSIPNHAPR